MCPGRLGRRRCELRLLRGDFLRYLLFGFLLWGFLLFRLLLSGLLLILVLPPTAQHGREPGTGLANDLVFVLALGLMFGRCAIMFFRRLGHRSATTSRRAAEPGAGQSDHGAVGVRTIPRVLIRFHGRAD
ncbi:MAG TPA: hypothetical protein VE645_18335 [Pseudonocardiaceae bacterium]|jgi:hypothetical protein|nr:hypothetical protein [Pseudonocardiaceae bacterium]